MLKKSDKIAIVATGSCYSENVVNNIINTLKNRYPFEIIYNNSLYQSRSAQQKAETLIEYCMNPEIKLIWSLRGGEGSCDLLPFLVAAKDKLKAVQPKLLLGFSDFTPILNYFSQELAWQCVHGMCAGQILPGKLSETTHALTSNLLLQSDYKSVFNTLTPMNKTAKDHGSLAGSALGGNLSLLNISVADIWQPDFTNKIVFIEDWHEKGYVVDRTLKYFLRINFFKGAKAIVFGDFYAGRFSDDVATNTLQVNYLKQILQKFADNSPVPVFSSVKFGHGLENWPIFMG